MAQCIYKLVSPGSNPKPKTYAFLLNFIGTILDIKLRKEIKRGWEWPGI